MQQITKNVYAETGFRGCNTSFVVTREGVVMIDTPQIPSEAVKWRDEIKKHGPVRYVINTEPHGDHFTGNCFFEGTVVAHEGTRQAILTASVEPLKERLKQMAPESLPLMEGFRFRPPTITLSHRLTLHLGDHTFQLINFPGHTPYQVAVFVPEERVVFTSDNVVVRQSPYMQQALPVEWLDSLKQMQELAFNTLVPGHGGIVDKSYLPEMSTNIQAWVEAVTAAIKQGLSLEEAQEKISFLDRYPIAPGMEAMMKMAQRMNVARLYEVLKTPNS